MKFPVIVLVAFLAKGYAVSIANFPSLNLQISNPIAQHSENTPQIAVLPAQQENAAPSYGILPSNLETEEAQMVNLPIQIENMPSFGVLPANIESESDNEAPSIAVLPSNIDSEMVNLPIQISNLPALHDSQAEMVNLPIQISNLPAAHDNEAPSISVLPSNIESEMVNLPIHISNLPALQGHEVPSIGVLPSNIESDMVNLPIHISNLPALQGEAEINNELPQLGNLPVLGDSQATPPCVGYIKNLLLSVLSQLDAPLAVGETAEEAEIANLPAKVENLPVETKPEVPMPNAQDESPLSACVACFQKVQLLVEKANSLNSILTF